MNKKIGFLSLLIAGFLFSTYGIFIRILKEDLSALQQLSYRYTIGIFIVLIIILIKKQKINFKKFINPKILLFSLVIPFSFYFFIRSYQDSKMIVAVSGFYAGTVLCSLLIGLLKLKEKIKLLDYIGLAIIIIGFIFLNNLKFREITNIGLIWGLISGIGYGIGNSIKK